MQGPLSWWSRKRAHAQAIVLASNRHARSPRTVPPSSSKHDPSIVSCCEAREVLFIQVVQTLKVKTSKDGIVHDSGEFLRVCWYCYRYCCHSKDVWLSMLICSRASSGHTRLGQGSHKRAHVRMHRIHDSDSYGSLSPTSRTRAYAQLCFHWCRVKCSRVGCACSQKQAMWLMRQSSAHKYRSRIHSRGLLH